MIAKEALLAISLLGGVVSMAIEATSQLLCPPVSVNGTLEEISKDLESLGADKLEVAVIAKAIVSLSKDDRAYGRLQFSGILPQEACINHRNNFNAVGRALQGVSYRARLSGNLPFLGGYCSQQEAVREIQEEMRHMLY